MISKEDLLDGLKKMKRYTHVWDWLEEDSHGEYVKYDDVLKLIGVDIIVVTLDEITDKQLVSLVDEFIDDSVKPC